MRVTILLIIAVALLQVAAHARFVHRVDGEVRKLAASASRPSGRLIDRRDLEQLPPPVRRWLEASGVVGRPRAEIIRLRQRGDLRTKPQGAWMPARAEEFFSVDPPAFVWRVDATMLHVLPIAGRDMYARGRGNMLIKVGSLVSVVDAHDDKIAQGALLRYLGEIIWFPSAALSPAVFWDSIDATHARATLCDGGLRVSAVFTFDERGRMVRLDADRYLGGGAAGKLTPWFATCSSWRTFEGIEVPDKGEVGWTLADGPFIYYRWEIRDLQFDPTDLSASRPRASS